GARDRRFNISLFVTARDDDRAAYLLRIPARARRLKNKNVIKRQRPEKRQMNKEFIEKCRDQRDIEGKKKLMPHRNEPKIAQLKQIFQILRRKPVLIGPLDAPAECFR